MVVCIYIYNYRLTVVSARMGNYRDMCTSGQSSFRGLDSPTAAIHRSLKFAERVTRVSQGSFLFRHLEGSKTLPLAAETESFKGPLLILFHHYEAHKAFTSPTQSHSVKRFITGHLYVWTVHRVCSKHDPRPHKVERTSDRFLYNIYLRGTNTVSHEDHRQHRTISDDQNDLINLPS